MGLVYLYTYIHKNQPAFVFFPMMSETISREGEIPVGSMYGILTDICPQKSSIHVGKYTVRPMDPMDTTASLPRFS